MPSKQSILSEGLRRIIIWFQNNKGPMTIGTGYLRTSPMGITIILEKKDDWDRDYSVMCSQNDIGAWQGRDKDASAKWNLLEPYQAVGEWKEGEAYMFGFSIDEGDEDDQAG